MGIDEKRYDEIKHCFGMWMYESFQNLLHIRNYNFSKLNIGKFKRSEIIDMGIVIFNQRVALELARKEEAGE